MSLPKEPRTARDLIALHEGRSYEPYYDTEGYPTQGIGHKLGAKHAPLSLWGPVDDHQINAWFDEDYAQAALGCARLFGDDIWFRMCDARQAAFIDMAFQMGVAGLCKFAMMISSAKVGAWDDAARAAADSIWHKKQLLRSQRDEQVIALIQGGTWESLATFGTS